MSSKTVVDNVINSAELRQKALAAARRGLDFLVRHQVKDMASADHGRFVYLYDCNTNTVKGLTTNWVTGVAIEAMLLGYQIFKDEAYMEAARRGVSYLRSMQEFDPRDPRFFGVFHEDTPQTPMFHPRDALTAAWALLDYSVVTGEEDALFRAASYGDWLLKYGMDAGYPRWTVSFETFDAKPGWFGSFHSGSAFFMARLYAVTGEQRYLDGMRKILDVYNELMLTEEGKVHVIVDLATRKPVEQAHLLPDLGHMVPEGWIIMHEYNDDFGALANLEAWRITGDASYKDAASRFLAHMVRIQRGDGGFGPAHQSIPSAGGSVLLELMAARSLDLGLDCDAAIARALDYVFELQIIREGDAADGAFLGFTGGYTVDGTTSNIRAGGYAILSLLRFGGAQGPIYFPVKA